ncbi:MAG: hypothetical protein NTZ16_01875 [Verrucomicrobia bacterium]|nr:hypothetical protein [Verrucomicrobiota bacterium]
MDTPIPPKTSFSHQAAKLSWVCPIIIFLLLMFGRQAGARVIIEYVALLLMVVGLVFGVVALFGIRTHGKNGILAPAILGIIINALLTFIFVTNFVAARARAQRDASETAKLSSIAPASRDRNDRQTYEGQGMVFHFDGAYALKVNKETAQIFLQHDASTVMVMSFHKLVDSTETLKLVAASLQADFKNQSYGGITQSAVESVAGLTRSGGFVQMGYDRPGTGHVHADAYILSDQTNSISLLHYYPDSKESKAKQLFQTLLQSLRDGN